MKKSKNPEARASRNEAAKLTTLGAGAGTGWVLLESGALEVAMEVGGEAAKSSSLDKKGKNKVALVTGVVALGALSFAAYKYMKANKIAEKEGDWQSKVAAKSDQHDGAAR